MALARRGIPAQQIARELDYADRSGADRAIRRAVQRDLNALGQVATIVRHLQYRGLQDVKTRLWVQLQGRPVVDPQGRPIMDPQTERPRMIPLTPTEQNDTIRTLVRLFEREARLMGADLQTVLGATPPGDGDGGLPVGPAEGEVLTIEVSAEIADDLIRTP